MKDYIRHTHTWWRKFFFLHSPDIFLLVLFKTQLPLSENQLKVTEHTKTCTQVFFFKDFIYLFLEWKGGRERGKHQCAVASLAPCTGDLARTPGMCPDWVSNRWPFGSQAGIHSTELHQPGRECFIVVLFVVVKKWKQPHSFQKVNGWTNYSMSTSTIKRYKPLIHVSAWMNLMDTKLNEKSQSEKII